MALGPGKQLSFSLIKSHSWFSKEKKSNRGKSFKAENCLEMAILRLFTPVQCTPTFSIYKNCQK